MIYRIEIELPGLPKMANGSHGHWTTRYREANRWKAAVIAAIGSRRPEKPFEKVRCVFTRFSCVEPDDDGLTHGFKPIRDALVRAGIVIDDKRSNMESSYRWERAPRGRGKISVVVEGIA